MKRWKWGWMMAAGGAAVLASPAVQAGDAPTQPIIGTRTKAILTLDGLRFRDADGDGALSPYEDWRRTAAERARDLIARMTVEEKLGTLVHATLPGQGGQLGRGNGYDLPKIGELVNGKKITSFITRLASRPVDIAEHNNRAQEVAERGRLGIPLTISTDPRNHFQYVLGASESAAGITQWPEPLGFAALGDAALVQRFGAIARSEYRAVGIHMALSPQVDLATDPRWSRAIGTFGSDVQTVNRLGGAYVEGFQGSAIGLARDGVLTVVKHWVGYGAAPNGFDAHNHYGRIARPGRAFKSHIDAFKGAFDARTGGLMPAYPILADVTVNGKPVEAVGAGFSKVLLTDLLRGRLGYRGLILSDWAITRDCNERCVAPTTEAPQRPQDIATSWGVEALSVQDRYVLGLDAGIDQFGGTDDVAPLMEAWSAGRLDPARIDAAVAHILEPKFVMGLFDNPYVDADAAGSTIGTPANVALAEATQRAAQVLLQHDERANRFKPGAKVWLFGMNAAAATEAGLVVVDEIVEADFAIVRAEAPSEKLHPDHFFGSRQKEGRLDFRDGDAAYDALKRASARVPTAFAIFLDRPAILTNVADKAAIILANFGADDAAVLDVLLGKAKAQGQLPFQLPRSMEQVSAQDPGVPDDIADPLYPRGAGLVGAQH